MPDVEPRIPVRLFGPPRIGTRGDAVTAPRRIAVLAYLTIARPRGLHSRDTLAALLWPDSGQEHARHALRNVLHALRRNLAADLIITAGDGLVGVGYSLLDCDVLRFDEALRTDAHAALGLYAGELLQGFHVAGAPAFGHWLDGERQRYHAHAMDAARTSMAAYRLAGDAPAALAIARRAHEIAPDDEPLLRRLLELLIENGDRASAERTYEVFRRRMDVEYESEPAAETTVIMASPRNSNTAASGDRPLPRRSRPTESDAAYTLYVRGTYLFLRTAPIGDVAELERCRECFEDALALDPQFAHAYSGLSNYYAIAAVRNIITPFHTAFQRTLEMSHRAIALDPRQAIPHVHFGVDAMFLACDWPLAGEELHLARQLDPTYPETHKFLGIWHAAMGRLHEAMTSFREAVRLEPHIPLYRNAIADALMMLGEHEEAIVQLRSALALEPRYVAARDRLIRCLERLARYEEAIVERRSIPASNAERFAKAWSSLGAEGCVAERRIEIAELIASTAARVTSGPPTMASEILNPPQLRLALWCAELGDWPAAREWMEHAVSRRPGQRQWFIGHPELAPLFAPRLIKPFPSRIAVAER